MAGILSAGITPQSPLLLLYSERRPVASTILLARRRRPFFWLFCWSHVHGEAYFPFVMSFVEQFLLKKVILEIEFDFSILSVV